MKNRFFGGVLACLVFVWFTDFAAAQVIQPICYFTNSPFNSPRNLRAGLTLGVDGQLYGSTSFGGGTSDFGAIFKVTTSGASTMVANLDSTTGGDPYASLTLGPEKVGFSRWTQMGSLVRSSDSRRRHGVAVPSPIKTAAILMAG